ncbi:heavy metal sensor histidine kinase [Azoarcus indigens]|uniref:Sensor protein n=1 Tax=Azoarcus indigens TaxID=29545 RepID=A0A4R6E658_9RHOO|nr:heavy metal sensor histidine kinase [Azoarcus indigens]NMG65423.1 heavy metal sensor histidine kinase [Azoarcus indigens]TDN53395.1 two-component system heavy metal sensor histidine kinase CusS [Azoarcus indigens]
MSGALLLGAARRPLSLTARLALVFAAFAASLLLVVGLVLGKAVEDHFDELDDHDLSAKLAMIGHLLGQVDSEAAREALPRRLDDALVGHDTVSVELLDAAGQVFYSARAEGFAAQPHQHGADTGWRSADHRLIGREAVFTMPLPQPQAVTARVGLDISHHLHFLEAVRLRLWFGISVAALCAGALGWLAARKGLAPLGRVTATARGLSAQRLGERLSERDAPAEVLALVEAFNGMLDRIEAAFRRLSEFSADLAHELRTPISNLMTETQVALSRSRGADDYREVLASNLEEFERIARMVGDMLFLAQAENGLLPRPAETVELADEARALADFYEALAEEQGVAIAVAGAGRVTGDRLMLRRALSNLLSNALRHAERGSTVEIGIAEAGGRVALAVRNAGDTIPPELLPRLFERFHRGGAARERHGEGAGLGLAITRSIVQAHGGEVEVESAAGLSTFRLLLPAVGNSAAGRPPNPVISPDEAPP